jgi:hypothetical protein
MNDGRPCQVGRSKVDVTDQSHDTLIVVRANVLSKTKKIGTDYPLVAGYLCRPGLTH